MTAVAVTAAAVQEVQQRAGEQDQIRDHAEQVRAVILPDHDDGDNSHSDKNPAVGRLSSTFIAMIESERAHRSPRDHSMACDVPYTGDEKGRSYAISDDSSR